MSMLAEPKRKQKWSLNPRGKEWSQDTNKFGQKMLEKMGWQHGKGLGPKESGITEHIKVSYKNDSKGMGYKESNDQWTEHETNFSALLQSLGGSGKMEEVKVKSLEKKSESSKVRVHYKKFTRGKDLSRYSEKDLANIFGKKSLKEVKIEDPVTIKSEDTDSKENNSGFLFNAGSMRDYFKKKLPGFGNSHGYMLGNNGVLKKADDDSESEDRPSFGFGFKSEQISEDEDRATFKSYIKEDSSTKRKAQEAVEDSVCSPMKKPKKDKKKKGPEENLGLSNPSFNPLATPIKIQKHVLEPIEEGYSENEETPVQTVKEKKKRKNILPVEELESYDNLDNKASSESPKKKRKVVETGDAGTFNPVFNESVEDSGSCESTNNPYEVKIKKKKKNKRDCENSEKSVADEPDTSRKNNYAKSHFDNPNFDQTEENSNPIEAEENPFEVKVKNKKKKNKKLTGVENPATEEICTGLNFDKTKEDNNTIGAEENPFEVKVKNKKKNNKKITGVENPVAEELCIGLNFEETKENNDPIEAEENPFEVKVKNKKNKVKQITGVENPVTEENSIGPIEFEDNPYEVKVKKKKKKTSTLELQEPNVTKEHSLDSHEIERIQPEKKKKKKDTMAIDNPSFNGAEESSAAVSQVEENPYEIRKKKKTKKQPIDNPSFVDSIEPEIEAVENPYEVKVKKKKKSKKNHDSNPAEAEPTLTEDTEKGIANPALRLDDTINEDSDLMFNIVSTPVMREERTTTVDSVTKVDSVRRRKSVRFSDVTQERIIPNKEEMRELYQEEASGDKPKKKRKEGVDNVNFDKQKTSLEENLDSISKTLDTYQAEIDNDINEEKLKTVTMEDVMVGEVGNPHGENEQLPDGTRLKFKYANLNAKTPFYHLDKVGPKKSYKHLIKGDILVMFKGTNLHKVKGYGARRKIEG